MKSSSKTVQIAEPISQIISALDHSNESLSAEISADITQARQNALTLLKKAPHKTTISERLNHIFLANFSRIALPTAIATTLVVVFSVSQHNRQTMPEIPLAMLATEIPNEDLALLENLDFLTWFSEYEQSEHEQNIPL